LLQLLAKAVVVLSSLLRLRFDLVDTRVPRELQRREDDDHEDDIGRRAVPRKATLVRLLPLRDGLDVRGESVREVVRLDHETARFDDLALDLAELFVDLVNHGWRRPHSTHGAS